ncbi:MAG: hypothetical protein JXM73_11550 [Anaerolineae bacterium]|nr:hypothetical protein [Anaerolineae bacterium]
MKRQNKWLLIVGLLSLLAALGGGLYAYRFYDALVTTAQAVTIAVTVPPYTALTSEMLIERDVPRGILQEPVYTSVEQLVGRVTTVALHPGQLIYHHQAVQLVAFRYTDDPALEVVSFPVDPERAVGGQVQIGHRVNVYRVRKAGGRNEISRLPAATETIVVPVGDGRAQAELLAEGIPVVDVRAKQGEPANRTAVPSQIEQPARPEASKPLQILTVAVDPETARSLVELAVDSEYEIWVSLSPLAIPETAGEADRGK